jgi:hypothetical protein
MGAYLESPWIEEECFLACVVLRPEETHLQYLKASHVIGLWNRVQAGFESGGIGPRLGSCGGKGLGFGFTPRDPEQLIRGYRLAAVDADPLWMYVHSSQSRWAFKQSTGSYPGLVTVRASSPPTTVYVGPAALGDNSLSLETRSDLHHRLKAATIVIS